MIEEPLPPENPTPPILWALAHVTITAELETAWGVDSVDLETGTGHYRVLLSEPLGWGEIVLQVTPSFVGGAPVPPKVVLAAILGPDQQTVEVLFSDLTGTPIDCAFNLTVWRIPEDPGPDV